MQFNDDVVGGTTLIRPAIQSPDYVAGESGWTINADGTAEFNDITIRGGETIGSDFLIYSGTPGPGTLILSISGVGGTDPYGNTYGPGFMSYGTRLGLQYISSILSGELFLSQPGTTQPASISYNDLGNGQVELFLDTGMSNGVSSAGTFISMVSKTSASATDGELTLNSSKIEANGTFLAENYTSGTYTMTGNANSQWITPVPVLFDRTFDTIPTVVVTPCTGPPATGGTAIMNYAISAVTRTGFTAHMRRDTGTTVTFNYFAMTKG